MDLLAVVDGCLARNLFFRGGRKEWVSDMCRNVFGSSQWQNRAIFFLSSSFSKKISNLLLKK